MFGKLLMVGAALALSAGVALAKDLNKIGISLGSMENPFFVAMAEGAAFEAKKTNPNVEITTVGYDYDLITQFSQIDDFITAGVDIILLTPSDPQAIGPAIKKARAAGIVVVAVAFAAEDADAVVATHNVQAGARACKFIGDRLGGKGNLVIINGPKVPPVVDRVKGCKAEWGKRPGLKILSDDEDGKGTRDGGMAVMQGLLTRFDHIDGVFAVNDPTAIGADLAAKQFGRKEMIISAVDGTPKIVKALTSDTLIQGSSAQDPYLMARKAVEIGVGLLNGRKPPQNPLLIPAPMVTRDNVKDYKGWTGQ